MQLYRRHVPECPYLPDGAAWTRCTCPIYADGIANGKRFRRSMRTRSWGEAEARLATVQRATPEELEVLTAPRLGQAVSAYLADLEHRRSSRSTVVGYRCQLNKFLEAAGKLELREVTGTFMRAFLDGKSGKRTDRITVSTLRKEVAVLRAFFVFCIGKGWVSENPAKSLHKPAAPRFVTQPFDTHEVSAMIEAAKGLGGDRGVEIRALLFTLLYSGLRISDVSALKRGAYNPRTAYLTLPWTQKTGAPVRLKLHGDAVRALDQLPAPKGYEKWFYLDGLVGQESRIRKLRRRIDYLGDLVGIPAAPHRFRDTFAVELLTQGADLRTVQHLLGHDSIETTERHYAHFVAAHQAILDRATGALKFGKEAARPIVVNSRND